MLRTEIIQGIQNDIEVLEPSKIIMGILDVSVHGDDVDMCIQRLVSNAVLEQTFDTLNSANSYRQPTGIHIVQGTPKLYSPIVVAI